MVYLVIHVFLSHRPIKGICGFIREIIVGLIANLATRELRRKEYKGRDLPPEHPRASSTDDVEGIISLFHEVMGDNFDLKQFFDEFPKVMREFAKRIDPDLPFFYWTGHQTRYQNFALPSFNVPSAGGIETLDQIQVSRRGDPGVFVGYLWQTEHPFLKGINLQSEQPFTVPQLDCLPLIPHERNGT